MQRALVMAFLVLGASTAFAGGGGELPFTKDYEKGMAEAKQKGKPFILYFTADG